MTAHILVVDDEPDVEALILQKFRHKIRDGAISFLFARDGVEALAALKANGQIDLVVTDINMPRMDGLSLLQKLQENEKQVSTIIVSAYGDMSNIRTAMNRGAFDFVTKPIDFQDLQTTITKTIRHIELLRDARQRQAVAERAYASLSRYFSPNLAQELASDTDAIDLGGQRREIATLFTDITSFIALVETLEPSVLGPLLNEYLTGMTDIVFAHDGTVAKIVGDALQVLFGAPGEQPDHAARAVACALALDEYAEAFRARCHKKGIALGVTRIGVHAGPAIVGNFGGGRFFDYTAYGDTINLAARLEAANKQLGTRICASATLAARVEKFQGRPVGDLVLRGRMEALRAFEPLRDAQYEDPATKSYLDAFAKLEAGVPDADKAEKLLRNLAQRLERDCSGVSGSILEGIDEILTVTRLGQPKELRRSLACTNIIENVMGTVRRVCRNVKRWRSASMAMRWTAAAMQEAAKGFRRLKAHKQLPALRAALEAHQTRNSTRGVLARQANAA